MQRDPDQLAEHGLLLSGRQRSAGQCVAEKRPIQHLRAGLGDILVRHQTHVRECIDQIIVFNRHGLNQLNGFCRDTSGG